MMAYNSYFPGTYQPNYYGGQNPYAYQQMPPVVQQPQQTPPVQRIQQSGFVLVQSEQEARAYPVAPGNSITFKDESQPYCYVKTMGFNQLDRPTFERYRLVKEDVPFEGSDGRSAETTAEEGKDMPYALKSDLTALWEAVDGIREKMKAQAEKKTVKKKVIEVEDDDEE